MKKWTVIEKGRPGGNENTDFFHIPDEIAQIMINRGIVGKDDIQMYIRPEFEFLRDPFLLKDMDKAVERIKTAVFEKQNICIYGDYDVDGVSSTSILMRYFEYIGYPVMYYIPNRLEEGYGLNMDAIDIIEKKNVDLIITVDCGITSVDEVRYAQKKGIDVIITDHHECQSKIPEAVAVIDPKQKDCNYPFKGICGCGVAFKLIHALSGKSDFIKNIDRYLEITSLATICDVMPVLDENRIIVKNGLQIMGKGANKGMKALCEVSGVEEGQKVRSSHLGFAIGPRINASGRLGFSTLGVELFTENNEEEAKKIAEIMDIKNTERQEIESRMFMEAEEMISANPDFDSEKVIVLAGENWHHGIIGIVASKLTEKYYRPSILLCIEGDQAVGSARSIKGFDIFSALCSCSEYMIKFGGHEQAAGMTVKTEDIDALRKKINSIADYELKQEDMVEEIKIEYEIEPESINLELVNELHILEPFGIKNPTPYFMLRNCKVKNAFLMGKEKLHLKMTVEKGREFQCVGFGMSYMIDRFDVGDYVDIVFQIDENTFRGETNVQLMLKDVKLNRTADVWSSKDNHEIYEKLIDSEIKSDIHKKGKTVLEGKFYEDVISRKLKRADNIKEILDDSCLAVVNTKQGYERAVSDIDVSKDEKIDLIFLSDIDKTDLKVYNKIIIYDYFSNEWQLENIMSNKDYDTEIITDFGNPDFIYLKNRIEDMKFNRDDFVVIYKALWGMKENRTGYTSFGRAVNISPVKLQIILRVLEDENLIKYRIDYENDIFEFEKLPKPKEKLKLDENSIVRKLDSIVENFHSMYI